VAIWAEAVKDKKRNFWERLAASHALMDRAFGEPPQAIAAHFQQHTMQILEVRWLPPDPNDHSKVIEPKPDSDRR
jgi:hypothetical protein